MKTFDEIYDEFQREEQTELKQVLEEAQKESTKKNKIALVICLIIDIIILSFAFLGISTTFPGEIIMLFHILMTMAIIDFIIYIILSVNFSNSERKNTNFYKEIVIKRIINNFYSKSEYFPEKEMPEYIYEEPKYNEHYNRYNSEDYLEAVINDKYSIQMAEVETVYESKDSDGDTDRTTRFHGLFAKIVMHKSITGELKIMQNGEIMQKNRLKMDSSEFEKYFDVKASNKIVGMQLLTADVMQELIDFQNNTNMKYDIVIKDNELYLRFHCGEMFEVGKLKDGPIDRDTVKKYFYMLNFTYNLSNKLINIINNTEI